MPPKPLRRRAGAPRTSEDEPVLPDTRAFGRAKLVERVLNRKGPRYYIFDWNGVAVNRHDCYWPRSYWKPLIS